MWEAYWAQIIQKIMQLMQKIVHSSQVVAQERSKVSETYSGGLNYPWTNWVSNGNAYFGTYS